MTRTTAVATDGISGRIALIAGATGPIGRATAHALAQRGARVGVLFRASRVAAERLVGELTTGYGDGAALAVQADLAVGAQLEGAAAAVEERLGPIGVLVNAAHPHQAPIAVADAPATHLRRELDAVAAHAALCARLVPGMREQGYGRIVYVSGALMARPVPGFGAYGAAKAAATTLTRYLALEEGRHGILAGIVAPGRVVDHGQDPEPSPEMADAARRLLDRMALPDFPTSAQVAAAVIALIASDALTGQVLWVTGGEPIWS